MDMTETIMRLEDDEAELLLAADANTQRDLIYGRMADANHEVPEV